MKKCRECYFYANVNIGGIMYAWCFNQVCQGLINDVDKAKGCIYATDSGILGIDIPADILSFNQKQKRCNKIKNKSKIFRFSYSVNNRVVNIISRFSHWVLILSEGKEYLYHQNTKVHEAPEYASMFYFDKPQFHLHKVFDNNDPMAIHQAFVEIENHDAYVLKNRYYKNIRKSDLD